jgi:hypothetical protein
MSRKLGGTEVEWDTSASGLCWWYESTESNIDTVKKTQKI